MKKSYAITVLIITLILITVATFLYLKNKPKSTPIKNFTECVAAGYPVMESYPRQCRAGDRNFVEEVGPTLCAEKRPDFCVEIYQPVCAKVNIQCIKAPCEPINQTFPNACRACMNPLVESSVPGECNDTP